jgi:FixJ family two-component response regulator
MGELEPLVFVVDDDQSVRTDLANLLATEDHAFKMFGSADEYLARMAHLGPACLVLDVQLPGLNGLALQRQLTEEGRLERIVFITGYGDLPMGIRAMKGGAVDFLPKAFGDDELLSAVASDPDAFRVPLNPPRQSALRISFVPRTWFVKRRTVQGAIDWLFYLWLMEAT